MSWDQMKAALDEQRKNEEKNEDPPIACPFDGEILDIHPQTGVRYCSAGNFKWEG